MIAQLIDIDLVFGLYRMQSTTEWTTDFALYGGIEVKYLYKCWDGKRNLSPRCGFDVGIQLFQALFNTISRGSKALSAGVYTKTIEEVVLGNLEHFS